ncbi:MAG: peptidase M23 [Legionellales bacterium]|nr:peptidase M23 [Legionellales bacterium]|tara:strand:+ start:654 stop:1586 length:933 start_codon:yes stop_codon:yes gene_type:complete
MWINRFLLCFILFTTSIIADRYPWQPGMTTVGRIDYYMMTPDDSLREVAFRYRVGYDALMAANPYISKLPTASSYVLIIPTVHILPHLEPGININLAERRLYYLDDEQAILYSYPVSIGRVGWQTPEGEFFVQEKMFRPYWNIPESIRVAEAKRGISLPKRIPPGNENPLGEYALRLSSPTYLIHVNFVERKVGLRSTSGCISLFADDMKELYHLVTENTPVHIFNQPVKVVEDSEYVYIESHRPLSEYITDYQQEDKAIEAILTQAFQQQLPVDSDWANRPEMIDYILKTVGIPQKFGKESSHVTRSSG